MDFSVHYLDKDDGDHVTSVLNQSYRSLGTCIQFHAQL